VKQYPGSKIGEIKTSAELGYAHKRDKYIWFPCDKCGKLHWVLILHSKPSHRLCQECGRRNVGRVGDKAPFWKGGVWKEKTGYICVRIRPDDFFYPMATHKNPHGGYILEHRLVMAKYMGRNLHPWEIVHHRNHIRDDNRFENLQLELANGHNQLTRLELEIARLQKRVTLLEAENILLREESNETERVR